MINNLVVTKRGKISYDVCEKCGSLWLDKGELDKMAFDVEGSIEYSSKESAQTKEGQKKCPRCEEIDLTNVYFLGYSDILLDYCPNCGGFWLDGGEISLINKKLEEITDVKGKGFSEFLNNIHLPYWFKRIKRKSTKTDYRVDVLPLKDATLQKETDLRCPFCQASLNQYKIGNITIEGCPQCKGLWLNKEELQKLEKKRISQPWSSLPWLEDEIDSIDKAAGKESKRFCPNCKDEKLISVNFGDSGVIIDWCPSCKGIWLDSNEFNQITENLKSKLNKLSSEQLKNRLEEELKDILKDHKGKLSEIKDIKAILSALVNTSIFEHPELAKILTEFSQILHSAGF